MKILLGAPHPNGPRNARFEFSGGSNVGSKHRVRIKKKKNLDRFVNNSSKKKIVSTSYMFVSSLPHKFEFNLVFLKLCNEINFKISTFTF